MEPVEQTMESEFQQNIDLSGESGKRSFREMWDGFDKIIKKLNDGGDLLKTFYDYLKEQFNMYTLYAKFTKAKIVDEKDDFG